MKNKVSGWRGCCGLEAPSVVALVALLIKRGANVEKQKQ